MRIMTLNLNGIRSAAAKGFFDWLPAQDVDVCCVQELKAQAGNMTVDLLSPAGLHGYFHYAEKKGYSGVGIYSRYPADRIVEGLGHEDIDAEGRYLEAQFGSLTVVSLYLPSGSSGEHRQAMKFSMMERFYTHLADKISAGGDIVICGDWNIAHQAIDLKNWRGNQKNSGFLPEERSWLDDVFDRLGWVDVYRRLHPEATDASYTWWSNRGQAWLKNVGWRIDYQIASPSLSALALGSAIHKESRFSDHAPLTIDYDYPFKTTDLSAIANKSHQNESQ